MSGPEEVSEALRWLRYAREDIDIARRIARGDDPAPRHACFLAQQGAEKALKAALVLDGVSFPFTHDLEALLQYLADGWPDKIAATALEELTEWGAVSRRLAGADAR